MQDVTYRKHDVQGGTETTQSKVKLLSLCLLHITYCITPFRLTAMTWYGLYFADEKQAVGSSACCLVAKIKFSPGFV